MKTSTSGLADMLYDYDLNMISLVESMGEEADSILLHAESGDFLAMKKSCAQAKKNAVEFLNVFMERHNTMADLGAF